MLYDYVLNPDGSSKFLYVGPKCREILELTEHELLADAGQFWALVLPEDMDRLKSEDSTANKERVSFSSDVRIRTQSGKVKWIQITSRPNSARPGELVIWSGFMLDISERKQAESALRRESEKNLAFLRNASDGIHILNSDARLIEASESFFQMLGYTREELIGKRVYDWDANFGEVELAEMFWGLFNKPEPSRFETRHRCKDGTILDVEVTSNSLTLDGRPVLFASSRDISERKQLEERIRQLAYLDPLTKLPNRSMLEDRLKQAKAGSNRTGKYGALMFLDLDNFKPLNDTWGHALGDLLLIEVANRIKATVREADTVARFGGDEFVVVLSELDTDETQSTSQAINVADKIRVCISEPYQLIHKEEGGAEVMIEHHCSVSIGMILFLGHEKTVGNLIKNADSAMYRAKNDSRNKIRISS